MNPSKVQGCCWRLISFGALAHDPFNYFFSVLYELILERKCKNFFTFSSNRLLNFLIIDFSFYGTFSNIVYEMCDMCIVLAASQPKRAYHHTTGWLHRLTVDNNNKLYRFNFNENYSLMPSSLLQQRWHNNYKNRNTKIAHMTQAVLNELWVMSLQVSWKIERYSPCKR